MQLRKANLEDAALLFEWANDREVREMSVHSESIQWPAHLHWMQERLMDANTKMFILESGDTPIGQIRFDKRGSEWHIGYSIAASSRGKGYGSKIIEMGLKEIMQGKIIALVKPTNIASVRIFTSAGFTQNGWQDQDGCRLLQFELDK